MTQAAADKCIFCAIASGDVPCYEVWSSDTHLAFLTPWPNTDGFTVVIPKQHHPSYVFAADEQAMLSLMLAAKQVAFKLDSAFDDVGRTGVMFEGFGVDHLHAKLFPMHGTGDMTKWERKSSKIDTFFDQYEGYISSHEGPEAESAKLQELAAKIRGVS